MMCGICGIYFFDKQRKVDKRTLQRMNNIMYHRGPDDEGYYLNGHVGLAHRRLSIIDLTTGHQPMANEDESVWITYNGEIYNCQNLRQHLRSNGHKIKTTSDTEVILHAYEDYNEAVCDHLRGIYAFAIWDAKNEQLLLARDRIGVKPLYFFVNDSFLAFASEIKALLTLPEITREINVNMIDVFINLRYVPGPETMFKDLYKLTPGHIMMIQDGRIRSVKYWDLQIAGPTSGDDKDYYEELFNLERESVNLRLMSDVPLGAFLSGGLDSSAIVAFMSQLKVDPINTFTIGSKKTGEINEFPFAELVSKKFQTRHFEQEIALDDMTELIKKVTWHFDEPISDPPSFALYMISNFAAKTVKVVLSGEGGDEIFGGYHIYYKMLLLDWIHNNRLSRAAFRLIKGTGWNQKVMGIVDLIMLPLEERYFGVASLHTKNDNNQILSQDLKSKSLPKLATRFEQYYDATKELSPLKRMLYTDLKSWLPDEILLKADKMSMANSIELRVPFLDHKLVEFIFNVPDRLKVNFGKTKIIQKRIMKDMIPKEILRRKKIGFQISLGTWLRNGLDGFVREILLGKRANERGYYNLPVIDELINEHASGKVNNADKLWRLITLESWNRIFIDGDDLQ